MSPELVKKLTSEKINATVTRKVFGRQKPQKSLHDEINTHGITIFLCSFAQAFVIFPAIIVGILWGISAFFEVGSQKALNYFYGRETGWGRFVDVGKMKK
jgi:hypothetical protein